MTDSAIHMGATASGEGSRPAKHKVVFVAGLTNSGSTILDLVLGGHGQFAGLGEVVSLLRDPTSKLNEPNRMCSCGHTLSECRFWSRLIEELNESTGTTLAERYWILLDVFKKIFDDEVILVDSSKSLRALRTVAGIPNVDLVVIHLLRDVRGWIVSRIDNEDRRGSLPGHRRIFALRRHPMARFLIWYYGNQRIQRFLKEAEIPHLTVGYEQLALNTTSTLETLYRFLEVEPPTVSLDLASSRSHIAQGNRVRLDKEGRARIFYDPKWFQRGEWELPALLFRHVMRFNRKWVYGADEK